MGGKQYILWCWLWLHGLGALWAQEPASFVIGAKELENVEVYSIVTTDIGELFASTNSGIYVYRHGAFAPLEGTSAGARMSLFGLVVDGAGDLFCHDLSGQVFQIEDDQVVPYLKVPEQYVSNRIKLFCNQRGELHYFSKGHCFQLSDGELVEVTTVSSRDSVGGELSMLPGGRNLISTFYTGDYQELEADGIQTHALNLEGNYDIDASFRSFFTLGDQLVVASLDGQFEAADGSWRYHSHTGFKNRFFPISDQEVWGLRSTRGLQRFQMQAGQFTASEVYFKDVFISTCWTSPDGTVFLGTFGQGILVIPNLDMHRSFSSQRTGKIQDFVVTDDEAIYCSQMGTGIIELTDEGKTLIQAESEQFYSRLFWSAVTDFGRVRERPGLYFEQYVNNRNEVVIPTTRCIFPLDRSNCLFGTAKGIWMMGDKSHFGGLGWVPVTDNIYQLPTKTHRIRALQVDTARQLLYASDINSTYCIDGRGTEQSLKVGGEDIVCEDMFLWQGELWCATVNHGILVFDRDQLKGRYDLARHPDTRRVRQVAIQDGVLYAVIDDYLAYQDLAGGEVRYLGCADGVCEGVNKFVLGPHKMWLLIRNSEILRTRLPLQPGRDKDMSIHLRSVRANESVVDTAGQGIFPYDQNQFAFELDLLNPALGTHGVMRYRLDGFENNWNAATITEKDVQYKFLPPGDYTFEYAAAYNGQEGPVHRYAFQVNSPFWLRWWFILVVSLLLVAIVVLIFSYRIRFIRKKQQEELLKRELKADFIEAELRALRSQMNPHFIFNALNSIQALILKSEVESSYDYLVLFSKLVRKTLHYSNEEFISLESEMEFLRIYLKLEKLRFDDDFHFELTVEGDVDISLPSLTVQPFIENALLHGLQHKATNKVLQVSFEVHENHLRCRVVDNGIGRMTSAEINKRLGKEHKSFAIKSIRKRLEMYQSEFGEHIGFELKDLVENDAPAGTEVELILPIKTMF